MTWISVVLSGAMGITLGLLGGGGSIIAVPAFVYILGFDAKVAIAMSLGVVGAVSLVGSIGHWREGNVNLRVALLFGGVAMVGTYAGARLAAYISDGIQLLLFALVMIAAAIAMIKPRPASSPSTGQRHGLSWIVAEGLLVGVLTGLVGVGGGFLVVPALVILGGMPMKTAVGTSLLVIALKSAAGFVGYLSLVDIPWDFMAAFSGVATLGMICGVLLTRWFPSGALQKMFAILLLVIGTSMLYANRNALTLPGHADIEASSQTFNALPLTGADNHRSSR